MPTKCNDKSQCKIVTDLVHLDAFHYSIADHHYNISITKGMASRAENQAFLPERCLTSVDRAVRIRQRRSTPVRCGTVYPDVPARRLSCRRAGQTLENGWNDDW